MAEIEIIGLDKRFGSNQVLSGVDLRIPAGEFVGLMGPNGAGKSTLIKILAGVYSASSGEIRYDGKRVRSLAERPEVGFIHQDLGLVDDMSVVDNLRLGEKPMRLLGPFLNGRKEKDEARRAIATVELDCPVETLVGALAPGEKALVAVARLLQRGADVLFIDEATSTLPPGDAKRLIASLSNTAGRGATVIMVSHKLSEILDATERIVVLLDGKIAADAKSASLDRDELASMVVASSESQVARDVSRSGGLGEELLRLEGACGGSAGPVDLSLRAGEVVGLTGLAGSGLHDIAYLAYGTLPCQKGRVEYAPGASSAIVPPHRESQGGFAALSIATNLTVSALGRWRSWTRLVRDRSELRDAGQMIERMNVVPPDPAAPFATLSGGNKQKVIFGRVLFCEPNVYILCEPTRGVDVATRRELYRVIGELRDEGAAVLVVTSDFEDLFAICDRISVVDYGRPGQFVAVDETSVQELEAFV